MRRQRKMIDQAARLTLVAVAAFCLSGCKTPRQARLDAMLPTERAAYLAWEAERKSCRSVAEVAVNTDSPPPAPTTSFSSGVITTPNGPMIYQQNTISGQRGGGFGGGFAAGLAEGMDRINRVDAWTTMCMMNRGWIDGTSSGWKYGKRQ